MGDARPALAALARGALKVVAGAPAQRFGDVGGLGVVGKAQLEAIDDFAHHAARWAVVVVLVFAQQAAGQKNQLMLPNRLSISPLLRL